MPEDVLLVVCVPIERASGVGGALKRSSITNHTFTADNPMTANLPKGYTFYFMSSLYISHSLFYKAICSGSRLKQEALTCLSNHKGQITATGTEGPNH